MPFTTRRRPRARVWLPSLATAFLTLGLGAAPVAAAVTASTTAAPDGPVVRGRLVLAIADGAHEDDGDADGHPVVPTDGATAAADTAPAASRATPVVELPGGDTVPVDESTVPAEAEPGDTVEVTLEDDGKAVVVETIEEPGVAPVGGRSILVVPVTWAGAPSAPPSSNAIDTAFAATDTWYRDASRGQVGFDHTVGPVVTLPSALSYCEGTPADAANAADPVLRGLGHEPNDYDHVAYLMPGAAGCWWAGLAFMPGRTSMFNNTLSMSVIAHELGHNLGLGHANFLACRNAQSNGWATIRTTADRSGACLTMSYQDSFSTMGYGLSGTRSAGSFTPPHLEQLGWFDDGELLNGTAGLSTCIAPLAGGSWNQPLAVKLPVPGVGDLYFANRQPVGVDADLTSRPSTGPWTGIQVHAMIYEVPSRAGWGPTSHRLGVNPAVVPYDGDGQPNDVTRDVTLTPGQPWAVPSSNLIVNVGAPTNGCVPFTLSTEAPATVPAAPTQVTATAGDGQATVSWTAPANGGSPITGYTVTSEPASAGCTTTGATSCTVPGLTNGTAYRFRVTATNAVGTGPASTLSAAVTPQGSPPPPPPGDDATGFVGVTPRRLLDSRDGTGGYTTPWGPAQTRLLVVRGGTTGVDPDATAVVLNVTGVQPTAGTYLTVWPAGESRPVASNLNLPAGSIRPNLVTVKVGANDRIQLYNEAGMTHAIADVVGYYVPGDGSLYNSVSPRRVLDSRDGTGGYASAWGPRQVRPVSVTGGSTGVPSGATAVVLNLTATSPSQGSFLTVFPADQPAPVASNLNVGAQETLANLVTVKVPTSGPQAGKVSILNNDGTVHVIADVVGYYADTGGSFVPLTPKRLLDSRDGTGGVTGAWGAAQSRTVPVTGGSTTVPADATAIVVNVTGVQPSAGTFVTAWPGGGRPLASTLNLPGGDIRPNLGIVGVGAGGTVNLYNEVGSIHLLADVVGYFR